MDNLPAKAGDDYVREFSKFIRLHELRLGDVGRRQLQSGASIMALWTAPAAWVGLGGGSSHRPKPMVLRLDPHHLYYLLIRFEGIGIAVGRLDVRNHGAARPMSYLSLLSAKDRDDTMSVNSFRSTLSAVSSTFSLGSGWWGSPDPPKPEQDLKYLYSAFTKIPALRLHQRTAGLVADFEDCPGENAVPLYAFKNLQVLELEDLDPRMFLGWDMLAEQLRSLSMARSGIEDLQDLLVDLVLQDEKRRNKEQNACGAVKSTREEAIEEEREPTSTSAPSPSLSRLKWHFLRYLNLSDNSLTFIPAEPLVHLTSLTHLDLSNNLLISVPPALANLPNLVSLNLADNMIESVLGIFTVLVSVRVLNISHNRLCEICGLERLLALERLDVRHNRIEDAGEIGRLDVLPGITEVWVDGNPFTVHDAGYRIKCLRYFAREGKLISLDGTVPSFFERGKLADALAKHKDSKDSAAAAIALAATEAGAAQDRSVNHVDSPQLPSAQPSSRKEGKNGASRRAAASPKPGEDSGSASISSTGRRTTGVRKKRNKRIVELSGNTATAGASSDSGTEPSGMSDVDAKAGTGSSTAPDNLLQRLSLGQDGDAAEDQRPIDTSQLAGPAAGPSQDAWSPSKAAVGTGAQLRYRKSGEVDNRIGDVTQVADSQPIERSTRPAGVSSSRRARVSSSLFEPSSSADLAKASEEHGAGDESTAGGLGLRDKASSDAFRKRIEALRAEVGENWLRVINQSDADVDVARTSNAAMATLPTGGRGEPDNVLAEREEQSGAEKRDEPGDVPVTTEVTRVVKKKGGKKKKRRRRKEEEEAKKLADEAGA